MGTICPFERWEKGLQSAAVPYPEESNIQIQWSQNVISFTPKCLRMYDRAALRNANKSIGKAFITAIQDTLLAPDFVKKKSLFNYNTIMLPLSCSDHVVVLTEGAAFRRCVFLNIINPHQNATHLNQLSSSHQNFYVTI